MHWVLKTAGKKWKDFKAELKKQYFNDEITNEELKKSMVIELMTVIGIIL
jgi:hypothetical protein